VVEVSPDFFVDLLSGSFIFEATNTILVSIYGILVILFMILLARTGTITVLAGFFTTFIEGMARFVHDLTALIFSIVQNPEQAATYAETVPTEYKPITWEGYIRDIGKMMFQGLQKLISDIVGIALKPLKLAYDELKKAYDWLVGKVGGIATALGLGVTIKGAKEFVDTTIEEGKKAGGAIGAITGAVVGTAASGVVQALGQTLSSPLGKIAAGAIIGATAGVVTGVGAAVGAVVGGGVVAAVEYAPAIISGAKSFIGGAVSAAKGFLGI